MNTKDCTKCKQTKPTEDFGKRTASKDGLNDWCKTCIKDYYAQRKAGKATADVKVARPLGSSGVPDPDEPGASSACSDTEPTGDSGHLRTEPINDSERKPKPFSSTPKYKAIVAAVDEVLGSKRYKFERCDVIDSITTIDAIWTATGMKATLSPQRTESGARSSVNILTFENPGGTAPAFAIRLSSPATDKIDRSAEKFMKMIIKSRNIKRQHVKASDIPPAAVPSPETMSHASARHYDPLAFCDKCHNMRRESQMHSENLCKLCHDDEKDAA